MTDEHGDIPQRLREAMTEISGESRLVDKRRCVAQGCTERTDPRQYPTLCRQHRDMVEDLLLADGLMDPDDYAHERGYITDDGEES